MKMAWLRAQKRDGVVTFVFVASKNNVADIFTKVLAADYHRRLSVALLRDSDTRPRGGGVRSYSRSPVLRSPALSPPALNSAPRVASSRLATVAFAHVTPWVLSLV